MGGVMADRSYKSIFAAGLFDGQNVVVTGGGSGIGRCIAHELASLGAHPILVGRKLEKLQRVQGELREDGHESSLFACDIRDEAAVQAAVQQIVAARGRIHHLVNNAGGQFPAPLVAMNQKGFETVVRTNLVGGFLFGRECVTQSMGEHGGSVVNIIADMWRGMPGMGHSGAARAGMHNLTMTMAVEWAPLGIRANSVAPGWIASSGFDNYDEGMRSILFALKDSLPARRLGNEAEVSAAVTFLLSPAASFITGECIRVDGGAPLWTPIFPSAAHDKSEPYPGFHRASGPKVFDDQE